MGHSVDSYTLPFHKSMLRRSRSVHIIVDKQIEYRGGTSMATFIECESPSCLEPEAIELSV